MLIVHNIRLSRILRNTWQVDLIMIFSCTGAYLTRAFLIKHNFEIPAIIPTVLGTAIAFFIGFNNNQAYDRWWEARKIWGSLVNDSRSWARSIITYISQNETSDQEFKALKDRMVRRHIGFLYALKAKLRDAVDENYQQYLDEADLKEINLHSNVHNAILTLQSRDLQQLSKDGLIDGFRFMELNKLLVNFSDHMGRAERIKNTVFPTTYNYFTKVFIWLFVVSLTLVVSHEAGVWAIFIGWLVGFVFVSTQINGMSLIDPFENNSSSVPLNQITRTIEINLLEMIGAEKIPAPVKPINDEYIL
ncbi:putative membrane protein [Pedobacter cryoconitis]|uniref:Putative membrane protein n=1 Tax=Pedobacter cryoconitis TaxID=188932 RepID=A0A7W8YWC7_9SPHI|nr:bestrophin family ion channel [Pedobacter cryoconitis]MBB5623041.1 putative membrane protein [Pedobacter cryoconitis]MBB5648620.1 putative membrane protein [Pedobacter cryoconitis]